MVGKKGMSYTVLRPAGKVIFGDVLYDATARSGMIEKDVDIVVHGYQNAQLIVDKV